MPKNPIRNFLYTQLFTSPPPVNESFKGKTVIITGASAGLGLSAAQQLASLDAARVILACRSTTKGELAKGRISQELTTIQHERLEVWPLDLTSFTSIKSFASRVNNELPRVDGFISNAGILTADWSLINGEESQIMTHVVGPILLCLLLKAKLKESSATISIVGSDMHHFAKLAGWADLPENQCILQALRQEDTAHGEERNAISKLILVLCARELSLNFGPDIIVNITNPGFCITENHREFIGVKGAVVSVLEFILGRKADIGARTLVAGLVAGKESHGQYMSDGVISETSDFVCGPEGRELQGRIWKELMPRLEQEVPGISST